MTLIYSEYIYNIMCNARAVTQPNEGPATDALEVYFRKKRQRESSPPNNKFDHFAFDDVFSELVVDVEGEEAFPSISWSFDDDIDECPLSSEQSLELATVAMIGIKRSRTSASGLLRSKSFTKDLAQLNSNFSSSYHAIPASTVEVLPNMLACE